MLAAASGAYDEQDGRHSEEAAAFAFAVMTTLGDVRIGEAARVHMAEIAARTPPRSPRAPPSATTT
ncbi:hypothetical protein ACFQX6_55570 [Streptosporangium lutulentum]